MFLLVFLFLISSCSQKTFDTKEELMSFVTNPENGLIQTKSVNGVDFSITIRPTDLMVYQENIELSNTKEVEFLRKKYSDFIYFNLSISNEGKDVLSTNFRNRSDYAKKVKQMLFHMNDKVHFMTKSRDTIPLLDYIYPRTYGMSNSSVMMLVFNRDVKIFEEDYCFLSVEDFGLHTGEVSFKIATNKLLNEPKLRFK